MRDNGISYFVFRISDFEFVFKSTILCILCFVFCILTKPSFSFELFIEGEQIKYNNGLISASSKTTLTFEDMKIISDSIEINNDGAILCFSTYLLTENLQFFGKKIRKEKDKITIENGWFSTCSNSKPHYQLTGKKIVINPGIVTASNIVLKVGNIPIFYIPFYSHPLKSKDSPYSLELGKSNNLGVFVKIRYNYSFSEKKAGFLLDYYQKKGPGLGIDILSNGSSLLGYYNKKDKGKRWLLDSWYEKKPIYLKIEKSSDGLVPYDYLKGNIKNETKGYLMVEKSLLSSLGRLVFEEKNYFSRKISYIPKANFFLSGRQFGPLTTSLDISGENVKEDEYTQNFTINPRISKSVKIRKASFLESIDIKARNNEGHSISSISNIRLMSHNENIKLDLGYSILYLLKEKDAKDKILFLGEGFFSNVIGSIEGEFLADKKEFDNIMFLFSQSQRGFSTSIDGTYKNNRLNACLDIGFEKERYGWGFFWLIKEKEGDTIVPSILLKRDNFCLKISGHYGQEDYLELFLTKAFHCVGLDFRINSKMDMNVNLSLR